MNADDPTIRKLTAVQCSAKSHHTGERCKNYAIRGGTVCRFHGGKAPQVERAASLRLAALVNPAIGVLRQIIESKSKKRDENLRLKAATAVLDRTGYFPGQDVRLSGTVGVEHDVESPIAEIERRIARIAARIGPPAGSEGDTGS